MPLSAPCAPRAFPSPVPALRAQCRAAKRSVEAPKRAGSVKPRRLASGLEKGEPKIAARIDRSPRGGGDADRKMHVAVVPSSNDQTGLACHSRMDGCLTKTHAVGAVLRRGGNTANHVAGIDVLESQLRLALMKVIFDLALEKNADVSETLISRRIGPGGFDQVLSGALGDYDQRVAAFEWFVAEAARESLDPPPARKAPPE